MGGGGVAITYPMEFFFYYFLSGTEPPIAAELCLWFWGRDEIYLGFSTGMKYNYNKIFTTILIICTININ